VVVPVVVPEVVAAPVLAAGVVAATLVVAAEVVAAILVVAAEVVAVVLVIALEVVTAALVAAAEVVAAVVPATVAPVAAVVAAVVFGAAVLSPQAARATINSIIAGKILKNLRLVKVRPPFRLIMPAAWGLLRRSQNLVLVKKLWRLVFE